MPKEAVVVTCTPKDTALAAVVMFPFTSSPVYLVVVVVPSSACDWTLKVFPVASVVLSTMSVEGESVAVAELSTRALSSVIVLASVTFGKEFVTVAPPLGLERASVWREIVLKLPLLLTP